MPSPVARLERTDTRAADRRADERCGDVEPERMDSLRRRAPGRASESGSSTRRRSGRRTSRRDRPCRRRRSQRPRRLHACRSRRRGSRTSGRHVMISSQTNDCPCEPDGRVAPTCAMFPSERAEHRRRAKRSGELRRPVCEGARPREVPRQSECKRDRRIEVRPADVTNRVDPEHDHEAEGDRDADVAELMRLRVDHHCAAACEHERERADRLGDERASGVSAPPSTGGSPGDLSPRIDVFTALTIAPCMPSATWCVNSTVMSSKPAAARPASYSVFDSAPAMQPTKLPRAARVVRTEPVLGDDVADADAPTGSQHAGDLGQHCGLVDGEVDHAVRDDDVDASPREAGSAR